MCQGDRNRGSGPQGQYRSLHSGRAGKHTHPHHPHSCHQNSQPDTHTHSRPCNHGRCPHAGKAGLYRDPPPVHSNYPYGPLDTHSSGSGPCLCTGHPPDTAPPTAPQSGLQPPCRVGLVCHTGGHSIQADKCSKPQSGHSDPHSDRVPGCTSPLGSDTDSQ